MSDSPVVWGLDGTLLDALTELGAMFERVTTGAYLVELPGRARVWLIAGEQSVAVEAFVLHLIEVEDPAPLQRHLLRRNLGLRSVHFGLDPVGDVFLVGSLPHAAVSVEGVDRVLGEVLQLLLDDTDALLALAYGTRLDDDEALRSKVLADGAGRRPHGTPDWAPRRDARR